MSYYNHQAPLSAYGGMPPYAAPPPPTGYPPGAPPQAVPPMGAPQPPFGGGYAPPIPHGYPPPAYPPTYPFSLQPTFPQPYPPAPPPGQHHAQPGYYPPGAPPAAFPQPYGAPPPAANPNYPPPPHAMSQGMQPQPASHFTHPAGPSIQMDAYGLPVIPGDAPVQYRQTFRVEEKVVSASRDSFIVRDQTGTSRYKVDGHVSFHERKVLKDAHNQTLLKLTEARFKLKEKITLYNARDVALITLQKSSAIQFGSKRVNGFLGGQPTGPPAIVITGNSNNTHFRIVNAQNQEIADIRRRKFSLKNMLTDQDTYDVTVNFGSPALICLITVAIDEIYED